MEMAEWVRHLNCTICTKYKEGVMSRTTLSDGSCMSIHFARAIYIMPHPQWLCTCCPAAAVQGVTRTFISTEKDYTYVAILSSISSSKRLQWQNIIYGRSNFRNGHAKCSLVAMAICPIKLPDLYCALHGYLVPLLEQFSGWCETRWPCLCTQTYLAADWCHFRGQTCRSSKHVWNIANAQWSCVLWESTLSRNRAVKVFDAVKRWSNLLLIQCRSCNPGGFSKIDSQICVITLFNCELLHFSGDI